MLLPDGNLRMERNVPEKDLPPLFPSWGLLERLKQKGGPKAAPWIVVDVLLKNHAAPPPGVPPESSAANHRCRSYDNRCCWYDYDRASIGPACSPRITMPARTAATFGTGAVEGHEREQHRRRRGRQ
jgi:hypothetical protein